LGDSNGLTGWLLVAVQAGVAVAAEFNYQSLPRARGIPIRDDEEVSIIIPARNEAHRLPALLRSLDALRYLNYEVIVVDDASSDGTGDLARASGARVITLAGPPPGWTGKAYACARGAEAAGGAWLLFTDADTVHQPNSLGVALAMAQIEQVDLMSFLARQDCIGFWERIVLPYAYFLYFAGAFRLNRTPRGAVANGQYILIRRESYVACGGHSAVRASLIEDVALARHAAALGLRVSVARGDQQVSVRMYDSLGGLWEGFAKNAFGFVRTSPLRGICTAVAGIAYGMALPAACRASSTRLRLALLCTPFWAVARWQQRFGVSPLLAALYPLAATVFQLIALDSTRRALAGAGATWKGRRYT